METEYKNFNGGGGNFTRNLITGILSVSALIITTIAITYAVWTSNASQTTQNAITVGCVNVTLTNESGNISIGEAYPISDNTGKTLTPYKFTVSNNCNFSATYDVTLESLNESTLDGKYVKALLNEQTVATTNLTAKLLSGYTTSSPCFNTSCKGGWKLLEKQVLGAKGTKAYDLRLWITEDADTSIANRIFNSKIVVRATPTNQK